MKEAIRKRHDHKRKGISPLIASVILIAVTLAIAGILATWAFQFVGNKTLAIGKQAECVNAWEVPLNTITYSGGSLSFSLFNKKSEPFSNLTAFVTYSGGARSQAIGALTAMGVLSTNITSLPSKPTRLQITSEECAGTFVVDTLVP
jgi:flagellin-like protein